MSATPCQRLHPSLTLFLLLLVLSACYFVFIKPFLSISPSLFHAPSFNLFPGLLCSVLLIHSSLCSTHQAVLFLSIPFTGALPEDITGRNQGRGLKGQMGMNERHKADDCAHTHSQTRCQHCRKTHTRPSFTPFPFDFYPYFNFFRTLEHRPRGGQKHV